MKKTKKDDERYDGQNCCSIDESCCSIGNPYHLDSSAVADATMQKKRDWSGLLEVRKNTDYGMNRNITLIITPEEISDVAGTLKHFKNCGKRFEKVTETVLNDTKNKNEKLREFC